MRNALTHARQFERLHARVKHDRRYSRWPQDHTRRFLVVQDSDDLHLITTPVVLDVVLLAPERMTIRIEN